MRFMLLLKGNRDTEAGVMPGEEVFAAMGRYNEALAKAGALLAGEGLHPSAKGARVRSSGGTRTVIDGPFTDARDLVCGFWMIDVKSREEAVEWAKRCPVETEVEIRQVFEASDLGPEFTPELREAEERLRRQVAERSGR